MSEFLKESPSPSKMSRSLSESGKRSPSLSKSPIMSSSSSQDEPLLSGTNQMVITVARMNPPTPGHMVLVETLISTAYENNIKNVYIVLSSTEDHEKNPLSCPEKKMILDLMIDSLKRKMIREDPKYEDFMESVNVETRCVPRETSNLFSVISELFSPQEGLSIEKVITVLGEDRIGLAESIGKFYIKKVGRERGYSFILLKRESMDEWKKSSENPGALEDINVRDIPDESMSGSLVRNVVKYGTFHQFHDIYDLWLEEANILILYRLIQNGFLRVSASTNMDSASTNPKKSKRPKTSNTSKRPRKGGKRTRRKPRKLKRFLYKKNTKFFQKNDN